MLISIYKKVVSSYLEDKFYKSRRVISLILRKKMRIKAISYSREGEIL